MSLAFLGDTVHLKMLRRTERKVLGNLVLHPESVPHLNAACTYWCRFNDFISPTVKAGAVYAEFKLFTYQIRWASHIKQLK